MKINLFEETEKIMEEYNLTWGDVLMITCSNNDKGFYMIDITNFKDIAMETNYENEDFIDKIPFDLKIHFKNGSRLERYPSSNEPEHWIYITPENIRNSLGILKIKKLVNEFDDFKSVLDLNPIQK